MKITFSILLTIFLITGLVGCYNCNEKPYLNIKGITVTTFDSRAQRAQENQPVNYDSLLIHTYFTGSYYGSHTPSGFSFIPAAVASEDCEPSGYGGSQETIESIHIITLGEFDSEYSSGRSLNNIISVVKTDGSTGKDFKTPLTAYLANIPQGRTERDLIFALDRKPDEKVVQFRVLVKLTNGEEYSGVTIPITIK